MTEEKQPTPPLAPIPFREIVRTPPVKFGMPLLILTLLVGGYFAIHMKKGHHVDFKSRGRAMTVPHANKNPERNEKDSLRSLGLKIQSLHYV